MNEHIIFTLVLTKGARYVLRSNGLFTKAQRQSIPQRTDTRVRGNKSSYWGAEGWRLPDADHTFDHPAVASSISLFII